jgi:hypothetical protein
MASPASLLQFTFATGIDESQRAEVVEPGAGWLVLENGRQTRRGGYSTRYGFSALTATRLDGSEPTVGRKVFADRDTLCRITETSLEAYSPNLLRWQSLGRVPEAGARLIDAPSLGGPYAYLDDIEVLNGLVVLSWYSFVTGQVWVAVTDLSGGLVRAPEVLGNSGRVSSGLLASSGNYVYLVRYNAASTLDAWYLDTSSASGVNAGWVAFGASLATDMSAAVSFALVSMSGRAGLIYVNTSAGTSQVTVKTFRQTGVLETATINTSSTTPTAVAIDGISTGELWCAWNEGADIKACALHGGILATTLATTGTIVALGLGLTATNIKIAQNSTTTSKARLWANETPASSRLQARMRGVTISGGAATTDGSPVVVHAAQMCRKPFYRGGRYYSAFFGADDTNSQLTVVVCDWTDDVTYLRPVAAFAPGLASSGVYSQGKFAASGTSTYLCGINVRRSGVADGAAFAELDFAERSRWQTAYVGNSVYLGGGLTTYSDGSRVAEAAFLYRPNTPTTAVSGTGLTLVTGAKYITTYEEVDADGNWHISGISEPSASTGAVANKTVTVTTTPLTISSRVASTKRVRVGFYRTDDGALPPYKRLGTSDNDTTSATITFADTGSYADPGYGAKLYEQPGVLGTSLDKRPPPGFSAIVSYNGMLCGAEGANVWWSGQSVSGEGTWFSPVFQVPIPGDGDVIAMASMDGALFAFKRREVYAITGEPPSDNGQAGGLGLPRRLAVDLGCVDARSVCVTALGVFFQSERGIELLTRAQTVEWIGQPVQATTAAYPICTSATVDPESATVLLELASTETSGIASGTGRTLVFDLTTKQWVSADRRKSVAGDADTPSQSACVAWMAYASAWRYCWIEAGGKVQTETRQYLHADSTIIAKRAISPSVKASGLQGHQHVNSTLLLGEYHTPHDLQMSFAYDYSATFKTPRTFTAAQLLALNTAGLPMQVEHGMHDDARGEAVRVQLQDVTPSSGSLGTGQGGTWVGLAFEVVPQAGAHKLPNAAR